MVTRICSCLCGCLRMAGDTFSWHEKEDAPGQFICQRCRERRVCPEHEPEEGVCADCNGFKKTLVDAPDIDLNAQVSSGGSCV